MSDIRLVNVVPIVNGWNDAAKKNLEEAKTLMASGNHLDYNKGVVKESVANLVSGFADDLMKAPAVDPESRRPVSHWVLQRSVAYCERCRKGYRITNGGANVLTFSYCPNCGAKMEEECVEASKAALKLRRVRCGVNPTPVSEKDAFENLVEELADIYLCSIVFFGGELDDNDPCNMCDAVGDRMVEIMEQKLARWKYRLMKKEDVDVPEE